MIVHRRERRGRIPFRQMALAGSALIVSGQSATALAQGLPPVAGHAAASLQPPSLSAGASPGEPDAAYLRPGLLPAPLLSEPALSSSPTLLAVDEAMLAAAPLSAHVHPGSLGDHTSPRPGAIDPLTPAQRARLTTIQVKASALIALDVPELDDQAGGGRPIANDTIDTRTISATQATPEKAGKNHRVKGDPLEGMNRTFFKVNQTLDRILFKPLSKVYKAVVPKVMRRGIRHVFNNLGEPVTFINDLLQLKPGRAVRTLGRFVINSTYGVAGIFDIAKKFRTPRQPNGFGNTLGRWGIGPGPYLFLPFIGPTNFRDLGGTVIDGQTLPWIVGKPFNKNYYRIPRTVLTGLDQRVERDEDLQRLYDDSADPYAALRSVYLQSRQAEVDSLRGKDREVAPGLADDLTDPASDPGNAMAPSMADGVDADPAAPAVIDENPASDPALMDPGFDPGLGAPADEGAPAPAPADPEPVAPAPEMVRP